MTDSEGSWPRETLEELQRRVSGVGRDDLQAMLAALTTMGRLEAEADARRGPVPSHRRRPRDETVTYRVRVDLDHADPPIWRRLDVRSNTRLDRLHHVIQAAFGWTDSHLHRFALGASVFDRQAELFLCPFDVEEGDEDGVPETEVRLDEALAEPGDTLRYCYDFGDDWGHTIVLEKVLPLDSSVPFAVCVAGRRAAPPEDCGGLRSARDLATVLDDPSNFDRDEVNRALRDPFLAPEEHGITPVLVEIVAELRGLPRGDDLAARLSRLPSEPPSTTADERRSALSAYLWFLDRVGDDGLPLTSAGYLRPDDVAATSRVIPDAAGWIGKANREVQTAPVLLFRSALTSLGLLREAKGRLVLTAIGQEARRSPDVLWRHLASTLVPSQADDAQAHAGVLLLAMLATSSAYRVDYGELAEMLNGLGWRVGTEPVGEFDATELAESTAVVLANVGPGGGAGPGTFSREAAALAADALLAPASGTPPADEDQGTG